MKYPIVVGTDLTHASDEALLQAESRASRDGTSLTVVHALSPRLWGTANERNLLEQRRELVAQQTTALTGRPRHAFNVVVERGTAHLLLTQLAASKRALLVVGSRTHHGVGHTLLKDMSERVVERAWGPVLVTRARRRSTNILVAVDRPFRASPALEVALEEARLSHAELSVVHCVNTSFLGTLAADIINGDAYARHPLGLHSPVNEARRALGSELRNRQLDPPLYVVDGDASFLISQVAARMNAGLVIVGTTHHLGATPSVTTSVLRHAPCSVLVVDDTWVLPEVDSTM